MKGLRERLIHLGILNRRELIVEARDGQGRALGIAEVWGLDVCG